MAVALFRETALGQIIRHASKGSLLKYPEELPDFVIPECYTNESVLLVPRIDSESSTSHEVDLEEVEEPQERTFEEDLEKQQSALGDDDDRRESDAVKVTRTMTREATLPYSKER